MSDPIPGHDPTEPDHATTDPATAESGAVRYPQIAVQLIGTDGNAFAIIAAVAAAIRRGAGSDAEKQFTAQSFACGSYDELLGLVMTTVDVT